MGCNKKRISLIFFSVVSGRGTRRRSAAPRLANQYLVLRYANGKWNWQYSFISAPTHFIVLLRNWQNNNDRSLQVEFIFIALVFAGWWHYIIDSFCPKWAAVDDDDQTTHKIYLFSWRCRWYFNVCIKFLVVEWIKHFKCQRTTLSTVWHFPEQNVNSLLIWINYQFRGLFLNF